jgi:hypothetical protein
VEAEHGCGTESFRELAGREATLNR